MRATIDSAHLADALKLSVAARSNLDVLQHVLVRAERDRLTFETTDLQAYVCTAIPAEVPEPGALCFLEPLLKPIAIGDGKVTLGGDRVLRDRSRFQVPTLPAEQFPTAEDGSYQPLQVSPTALAAALRAVAYCASEDAVTPSTRALFVEPLGEGEGGIAHAFKNVIAARVAFDYTGPVLAIPPAQVARVLAMLDEDARLEFSQEGSSETGRANLLRITRGNDTLTVRLASLAPYPIQHAIASSVPDDDDRPMFAVDIKAFSSTLRRFLPFTEWQMAAKGRGRSVCIETDNRDVIVTDRTGESVETLGEGVVAHRRGEFRFAAEPKQLLDALAAITSDTARIYPPSSNNVIVVERGDERGRDVEVHLISKQVV